MILFFLLNMTLFTVYIVVLTAQAGFNKKLPCIPLVSMLLRLRRAFMTKFFSSCEGWNNSTKLQQTHASSVVHRPVAQRALRMQRPAPADQHSPASSSAGFNPPQLQYRTSQAHQPSSKTHPPAASSFAASAADTAAAMSMSLRQTSDELQSHASQVQGAHSLYRACGVFHVNGVFVEIFLQSC